MEKITLGQIAAAITLLVAIVSGIGFINARFKKWLNNTFKERFDEIDKRLEQIEDKSLKGDMENCKDILTAQITRIARGQKLSDIEIQRFWERYEDYIKHGGNSYIHREVEILKEQGLL